MSENTGDRMPAIVNTDPRTADFDLAALKRLDNLGAAFEAEWRAGRSPKIKEYLAKVPAAERPKLFRELLQVETELREETGQVLGESLWLRRFPEHKDAIAELFHLPKGPQETPLLPETVMGSSGRTPGDGSLPPKDTVAETKRGRIGEYRVVKVLGRGGMGVVYLARHARLNRMVALKMIRSAGKLSEGQLARFSAEATAVARLQHPGIVQIYGAGKQKTAPYLVLEYVGGGNLETRLAGRPQPPREAAALVAKLARAIQVAHDKGVIHRDLKPSNVLLVEDEKANLPLGALTPKITDFGLAKHQDQDDLTKTGQVMGTPDFMPPEQAKGAVKEFGPACDIYSLGAVLYAILAGKPPFRGTSAIATLDLVCNQEPVSPRRFQADCPKDLETICLKCLEKAPAKRYASAAALADDLERFLAGKPVAARPVSWYGRVWRWSKRNTLAACAMACVVLVLMVGTGVSATLAVVAANRAEEAERAVESETKSRRRIEWLAYANQVCLAQREQERGRTAKASMVLDGCRVDFRHWEHAYVKNLGKAKTRVLAGQAGGSQLAPLVGNDARFSPDGKRVARVGKNNTVVIQTVEDGAEVVLQGHEGPVQAMAFSADGRRLVTGGADGLVKIWETEFGQDLLTLEGHTGSVKAVAFGPGEHLLTTAGSDGAVRVWAGE